MDIVCTRSRLGTQTPCDCIRGKFEKCDEGGGDNGGKGEEAGGKSAATF